MSECDYEQMSASDFFLYITVSLYNADVITTSSKMPL